MGRNITPEGVRVLGAYLRRQLEEADLQQIDLVDRLAAIGFKTNNDAIHRLVGGKATYLRLDLIFAIAELKLFTDNEGNPLTAQDFNEIACEMKQPPALATPDPAKTAYPEAVALLLKKKGRQSVEDFAKKLSMKPRDLEAILSGQRPTVGQLLRMGVLFEDGNPLPLGRAYGMAEDAPLPNSSA